VRGKIKGSFGNIQSMAYDWIGKNLYFSSSNPKWKNNTFGNMNTISVLKLDSRDSDVPTMRTLVSKNFLGPSSIALDVENGKEHLKVSKADRQELFEKVLKVFL
jgi:hypothetical protein